MSYRTPMTGTCTCTCSNGPAGCHVNGKYQYAVLTEATCTAACTADDACVGYEYTPAEAAGAVAHVCYVYGPGVAQGAVSPWHGDPQPCTTISGANGQPGILCVIKDS